MAKFSIIPNAKYLENEFLFRKHIVYCFRQKMVKTTLESIRNNFATRIQWMRTNEMLNKKETKKKTKSLILAIVVNLFFSNSLHSIHEPQKEKMRFFEMNNDVKTTQQKKKKERSKNTLERKWNEKRFKTCSDPACIPFLTCRIPI